MFIEIDMGKEHPNLLGCHTNGTGNLVKLCHSYSLYYPLTMSRADKMCVDNQSENEIAIFQSAILSVFASDLFKRNQLLGSIFQLFFISLINSGRSSRPKSGSSRASRMAAFTLFSTIFSISFLFNRPLSKLLNLIVMQPS